MKKLLLLLPVFFISCSSNDYRKEQLLEQIESLEISIAERNDKASEDMLRMQYIRISMREADSLQLSEFKNEIQKYIEEGKAFEIADSIAFDKLEVLYSELETLE